MAPSSSAPKSPERNHDPFRDVMVMLMHYPQNDFDLNPWEIVRLVGQRAHNGEEKRSLPGVFRKFAEKYRISKGELTKFFQYFYENQGGPEQIMKAGVKAALMAPFMDYLLDSSVIDFLGRNCDALQWEFCRACSASRSEDPFTEGIDVPMVSKETLTERSDDCMMTSSSAYAWARETLQFPRSEVKNHYDGTILLGSFRHAVFGNLTFSSFIVFAIRCFSVSVMQSRLATGSIESEIKAAFFERVSGMIAIFNEKRAAIEKTMRVSTLRFITSSCRDAKPSTGNYDGSAGANDTSTGANGSEKASLQPRVDGLDTNTINESANDSAAIQAYLHNIFSVRFAPIAHQQDCSYLPPRPPLILWDAPRCVEYAKFSGLLCTLDTVTVFWQSFRIHDSGKRLDVTMSTHGQKEKLRGESRENGSLRPTGSARDRDGLSLNDHLNVVSPLPVQYGPSLISTMIQETVYLLSRQNILDTDSTADNDNNSRCIPDTREIHMNQLENYEKQILAPISASIINKSRHSQGDGVGSSTASLYTPPNGSRAIEDLLRYGGSEVIAALGIYKNWITESFNILQRSSGKLGLQSGEPRDGDCHPREASLSVVCRYLSCHGLLRAGLVAVHAKRALHPRIRPLSSTFASEFSQNTHDYASRNNGQGAASDIDDSKAQAQRPETLDGPATRSKVNTMKDVTLSRMEYEELLLRCSLCAWEISGVARNGVSSSSAFLIEGEKSPTNASQSGNTAQNDGDNGTTSVKNEDGPASPASRKERTQNMASPFTSVSSSRAKQELSAEKYCEACESCAHEKKLQSNSPTHRSSKRWGTDYLTPYIMALQAVGSLPAADKEVRFRVTPEGNAKAPESVSQEEPASLDDLNERALRVAELLHLKTTVPADHLDTAEVRIEDARSYDRSHMANGDVSRGIAERGAAPRPTQSANLVKSSPTSSALITRISAIVSSIDAMEVVSERDVSPKDNLYDSSYRKSPPPHVPIGSNDIAKLVSPSNQAPKEERKVYDPLSATTQAPMSMSENMDVRGLSIMSKGLDIDQSSIGPFPVTSTTREPSLAVGTHMRSHGESATSPLEHANDVETHVNSALGGKHGNGHQAYKLRNLDDGTRETALIGGTKFGLRNGSGGVDQGYKPLSPTSDDSPNLEPVDLPFNALLEGTKEALWPVFATYCSCGDSVDPGKLSGPNLFTLLSKLGILNDHTVLSDIGILIHQVCSQKPQSHLSIPLVTPSDDIVDSPSLAFEEFLVFLCAFAQLRFEGSVKGPNLPPLVEDESPSNASFTSANDGRPLSTGSRSSFGRRRSSGAFPFSDDDESTSSRRRSSLSRRSSASARIWHSQWQAIMTSSPSFHRLLQEYVLPVLRRYALLAFPEDARQRDRFSCVFSLEVLLAVQSHEAALFTAFNRHKKRNDTNSNSNTHMSGHTHMLNMYPEGEQSERDDDGDKGDINAIMDALTRINLVPQVISEGQVMQLVKDVLPGTYGRNPNLKRRRILFPQWAWVICVVAFEAVDTAVKESVTATPIEKVPSLVADLIGSIASVM